MACSDSSRTVYARFVSMGPELKRLAAELAGSVAEIDNPWDGE
jgi:hypothetical protein